MPMNTDSPTTLILFGATGDLAKHKLLPALHHLFTGKHLPEQFHIVAFARKDFDEPTFRDYVREEVGITDEAFLERIRYTRGDMMADEGYQSLAQFLNTCDEEIGTCTNKLFYLAVPPKLYDPVFDHLSRSGLTTPCATPEEDENTWARVLVEKPFGFDREEARELDLKLGSLFDESQVYRIDHYLAKETIQNMLTFRFANTLFEPAWNAEYIESITIRMHESVTAKERGAFYDGIGALRDVGQNHILQMLALVTMEDPMELSEHAIRASRAAILEKTSLSYHDDTPIARRAQYEGYRETEGVADNSQTETFFQVMLEIDSGRWRGVPIMIESGKGLPKKHTEVRIKFKERRTCVCTQDHGQHANELIFWVQPGEGITVRFYAKKPGFYL